MHGLIFTYSLVVLVRRLSRIRTREIVRFSVHNARVPSTDGLIARENGRRRGHRGVTLYGSDGGGGGWRARVCSRLGVSPVAAA